MILLRYKNPEVEDASGRLTARQRDILQLVVSGYITSSQPISSFYLIENFNLGISSATVRSIFAELENQGYLFSPHRSSGRIPTEKGYRTFVEMLPSERSILDEDQKIIQQEYLKRDFHPAEVMDVSCRILSLLTDYAGVVLGPKPESAVLKHLELLDMGQDEILLILVTRSGLVYSRHLFLEKRVSTDYLHRISRFLNYYLQGKELRDVKEFLQEPETMDLQSEPELMEVLPVIARAIASNIDYVRGEDDFFTAGIESLYASLVPESAERIRELGRMFESTNDLRNIFKEATGMDHVLVSIEGDREPSLNGLSVVSAAYKMGERKIGSLGVVGPNRMDYLRVISIVEYMSMLISRLVTRMSN